jgi:16S rRNA (guanine966-N2)-methyltransferase
MSILQHEIPGSKVLDLYAGSGALGLEALSRGADHADFVENNLKTLRVLRGNIDFLDPGEKAEVHRTDAMRFAMALEPHAYDLAFADPPYASGAAEKLAEVWLARPFARILSVEHNARETLPGSLETRRYGTTAITFYRIEE